MGNVGDPIKIIEVEEVEVPNTVPAFEPSTPTPEPAPTAPASDPEKVDEPVGV